MALLGFTLPPDSGEKLSLGMLNFDLGAHFLLVEKQNKIKFAYFRRNDSFIINRLPQYGRRNNASHFRCSAVTWCVTHTKFVIIYTSLSKTKPTLSGTYFNCIMFMVASSVVSTILILNYHHRNADTHEMSEWVKWEKWPCILFIVCRVSITWKNINFWCQTTGTSCFSLLASMHFTNESPDPGRRRWRREASESCQNSMRWTQRSVR